jgi:uncharacterized membrane protein YbhN (UPF0104 family)
MKVWLRIAISFGVLGVLLWLLPWTDVRQAAGRLSWNVWLPVLAAFIGGHALGSMKWRMLVNAGRAHLRAVDAVRCYAAGLFANMCLPSIVGGDVLRATLAVHSMGRSESAIFGSVADRVIDIATMAVLVSGGALFAREALPAWGETLVAFVLIGGVAGALLGAFLVTRRPLAAWPRKVRRPLGRALVAVRYLARSPQVAIAALAISITMQGGFAMLNAWIGRSIGIDLPVAVWFVAWPLAKLTGLLPISLGGLGVRDATLGALLVPLGVAMSLGLVASLIWQTVLIAGGLLGGALWWAMSRKAGLGWSGKQVHVGVPAGRHA